MPVYGALMTLCGSCDSEKNDPLAGLRTRDTVLFQYYNTFAILIMHTYTPLSTHIQTTSHTPYICVLKDLTGNWKDHNAGKIVHEQPSLSFWSW